MSNVRQLVQPVNVKGGSYTRIMIVLSDPAQLRVHQQKQVVPEQLGMHVQFERQATQLLKQAEGIDRSYTNLKHGVLADIQEDLSRIENNLTREDYEQPPISADEKRYAEQLTHKLGTQEEGWNKLHTEATTQLEAMRKALSQRVLSKDQFQGYYDRLRLLAGNLKTQTDQVQTLRQDLSVFAEKTKAVRIRMNLPAIRTDRKFISD